jgi:hypothetical protein
MAIISFSVPAYVTCGRRALVGNSQCNGQGGTHFRTIDGLVVCYHCQTAEERITPCECAGAACTAKRQANGA